MNLFDFKEGFPGQLVRIQSHRGRPALAFLPNPLPPNLNFDSTINLQIERAAIALGNLNGLGTLLPNPLLLIQPFVRREAQASSRIEGTRADFEQLAFIEASPKTASLNGDFQEVTNYMEALLLGWNSPSDRPLTTGLANELHRVLMTGVRGQHHRPGQLRDRQVMIDSPDRDLELARFVPPPPLDVRPLVDDLFTFMNAAQDLPALIKIACIHYQFESIHPFEDGNGRIGRLMIPLMLRQWGLLEHPILYLSEYFERNRDAYIDGLYGVSTCNDWQSWITFVIHGIELTSKEATRVGRNILMMREDLRARFADHRSPNMLKIVDSLFAQPYTTFNQAVAVTGLTHRAARILVRQLESDGLLKEVTGRNRHMVFVAREILDALKPNFH